MNTEQYERRESRKAAKAKLANASNKGKTRTRCPSCYTNLFVGEQTTPDEFISVHRRNHCEVPYPDPRTAYEVYEAEKARTFSDRRDRSRTGPRS